MRLKTRSYLIPLRLDGALGGEVPSVVDILQFPEYTSARQYIHGNGNNFYFGRSNNFCCQLLHSTNSLGNTLFHSLSLFAQTHCGWSHSAISYFLHMPLFISTCRRSSCHSRYQNFPFRPIPHIHLIIFELGPLDCSPRLGIQCWGAIYLSPHR